MGYKLQRGTNGEEGYYRLSLDLPLTAHEVREIANQAIEEGWSFASACWVELREEIEALEADAKWTAFVHFLPPSGHDLIWRADGPFTPVTAGPAYGRHVGTFTPQALAELLDGLDDQRNGADVCDAVARLAESAFARCPIHDNYSAAKPRCPFCDEKENA